MWNLRHGRFMAIYLGFESAIEMICYLRTRAGDNGSWCKACTKILQNNAVHTQHELMSMDKTALSLLDNLSRPLHVLVRKPDHVTMSESLHPHLWSGNVGRRAFIDLGHDVYLSMPSFVFLQMATSLSKVELIMLGMMLCGYYSPEPSFGRSWRKNNLNVPLTEVHTQMVCNAQAFELEPLCTEKALKTFLESHPGVRGIKAAKAALPWVRNTSASHMETALYLLLCLPIRMGGYGLPKPCLNPLVHINQASGSSECYPDLYWPGASVDMEYNSDWAHCGVSSHYLDSRRMTAISCNNIDYLSISTGQLKNVEDMDNAARGLAKKLKHRIRYDDKEWRYKRMQLRAAVLPPLDL